MLGFLTPGGVCTWGDFFAVGNYYGSFLCWEQPAVFFCLAGGNTRASVDVCLSILEAGEAETLRGDCFVFEAVTALGCLTWVDNSDTCTSEQVTQNTVPRGRPIATCRWKCELCGTAGLRRLTMKLGEMEPHFPMHPHFTVMVTGKMSAALSGHVFTSTVPCALSWLSLLSLFLSFCGFPFCLWNLCPCVSISSIQAPPSLEGLFPQNERSLIKISTLETEAKGATTQKSNFRQKQKSHEVLANTAFQLTTVRVNISCGSPPKEATPSVEGLI